MLNLPRKKIYLFQPNEFVQNFLQFKEIFSLIEYQWIYLVHAKIRSFNQCKQ